MIFLWLRAALLFLAKLIIPAKPQRVRIDVRAACRACGHPSTEIRTVRQGAKLFIEHACETCKARWYEEVISDQNTVVIKAAGEP